MIELFNNWWELVLAFFGGVGSLYTFITQYKKSKKTEPIDLVVNKATAVQSLDDFLEKQTKDIIQYMNEAIEREKRHAGELAAERLKTEMVAKVRDKYKDHAQYLESLLTNAGIEFEKLDDDGGIDN